MVVLILSRTLFRWVGLLADSLVTGLEKKRGGGAGVHPSPQCFAIKRPTNYE